MNLSNKQVKHFNSYGNQLQVGKLGGVGRRVWQSRVSACDKHLVYWCGNWGERTPESLYLECASIMVDLKKYHPDLVEEIKTAKASEGMKALAHDTMSLMNELTTSMQSKNPFSPANDATVKVANNLEEDWRWQTIKDNLMKMLSS